jgi:hypothetical protein
MCRVAPVDDLVQRVPPPAEPVDADPDWAAAEAELGLGLPDDVKGLVARYGRGEFCDLVTVAVQGPDLLEPDRLDRAEFPEDYPFPLYPEPAGLLVWGTTSNGDRLCWLTDGTPDRWPVVVWNPRGQSYERHPVGAVAFLEGWLGGRISSRRLGVPPAVPWFEPPRELVHVYGRLGESPLPYADRLRILRDALAPTADRGGVQTPDGGRQDRFAATAVGWRVTYETAYGHQVRVAHPPGDGARVRAAILAAARAMGCTVTFR